VALLLLSGPLMTSSGISSGTHGSITAATARPASSDFTATVLFQGADASDHTDPGSAIATQFDGGFTTVFTWASPNQATLVTKGVLTVLFLGASVGTTSNSLNGAVPKLNGSITLHSGFAQDQLLFEGVYQVQASLFDLGTAIWNTTFYVWVQAPSHLTVVNIALILIGLFEVYQIAALGSARVARKELGLDTPPIKGSP
jgi:hypothetical protein